MNLKMLNGFGLRGGRRSDTCGGVRLADSPARWRGAAGVARASDLLRIQPDRVSCITTPDAFTHRPHGNGAVSYVERRRHWLVTGSLRALYALVTFQWQCEGCVLEDADFSASPLSPSCLSRHHRGDGTHSRVVAMLGRRGLSCDARGELVDGQEA